MLTVHSTLFLFDKPGWALTLLQQRGWRGSNVFRRTPGLLKPPLEERLCMLMERAPEIEYLITDTTPITAEFMDKAAKLRLVAMFGVGTDHIDVEAATRRGIAISRAIGGNSRSVAELAVGYIFCLARHLRLMDAEMRQGLWQPHRGVEIHGKSIGIVGLGAIGTQVALLARGVGMRIFASVRTPKPDLTGELGCTILPLPDMLAAVDYLCLCVPGSGSKPLLGAGELALMKPGAAVINVARGNVLDLDALITALKEKKLGGAALDVFPEEPMDPSHPIFTLPNVVLSPHTASSTGEAMARVLDICLDEVEKRSLGKESANVFNPGVYGRCPSLPIPEADAARVKGMV